MAYWTTFRWIPNFKDEINITSLSIIYGDVFNILQYQNITSYLKQIVIQIHGSTKDYETVLKHQINSIKLHHQNLSRWKWSSSNVLGFGRFIRQREMDSSWWKKKKNNDNLKGSSCIHTFHISNCCNEHESI